MRFDSLFKVFIIMVILISATMCFSGSDEQEKIPITTASAKALDFFLQGRDLQESLQGQESIQYFENAVKEDPEFAMSYVYLSLVSPTAKGFFESFDKAKNLVDKVSEGEKLWILGFDAGVKALTMEQRSYYTKLTQLHPADERAHNLLGGHYFGQQDYEKAIECYNKAIKINPDFSQPYNQLGYAHRFLYQFSEAEKAFEKYIALIPKDPNPYDSYAELQMKMGNYDKSITFYKKALEHNPNFIASHIGIATNLNFKDEHEKARKQLTEVLSIARNDGEQRAAHFATAVSYMDEGKMEKAIVELEKQLVIAKKNNDAAAMAGDHVLMGNIYLEFGQTDDANKQFEQAIKEIEKSNLKEKVKDNFRRAYLFNVTRSAIRKNDLRSAKKSADQYRQKVEAIENPFQIRLSHQLMGMIALAEQDYEDAGEELEQSNQQNPYNLYRLSIAYQGNKNPDKAKEYLDRAVNFNALNNMNYAFIRNKLRK